MKKLFQDTSEQILKNNESVKKPFFRETPNSLRWYLIIAGVLGMRNILDVVPIFQKNAFLGLTIAISSVCGFITFYIAIKINFLIKEKALWVIKFFWIQFGFSVLFLLYASYIYGFFDRYFLLIVLISYGITKIIVNSFNRFFKESL